MFNKLLTTSVLVATFTQTSGAGTNDTPSPPIPPAQNFPSPPYAESTFIRSATVAYNETVYTGIPSDTWPSVWAPDGSVFALGGDMPGQGDFACRDPHTNKSLTSYANAFKWVKWHNACG